MNRKGFTLVELMVVVGVIAIMAAVAVPIYTKYVCRASWGQVQSCIADVGVRLENYRSNRGTYPDSATAWADLGYPGGTAPDCGENYDGYIVTTNSTYLVYFQDTKSELSCTAGSSFDNDTWAIVNASPKVFHVFNTSDDSEDPLPDGYAIP